MLTRSRDSEGHKDASSFPSTARVTCPHGWQVTGALEQFAASGIASLQGLAETVNVSLPAVDLPRLELPTVELPQLPQVDLPTFQLPSFDLSLPSAELPSLQLPSFDQLQLPKLEDRH